jgi:hypothetical protein
MEEVVMARHRLRRVGALLFSASIVAIGLVAGPGETSGATIPAESFGGHWPGDNGLDTRSAADNAEVKLDAIGYSTSQRNDATALSSMGVVGNDAVWVAFGHANKGWMQFARSSDRLVTDLYATKATMQAWTGDANCHTAKHECLSDFKSRFTKLRLMAFVGCYSALAKTTGGDLLTVARDGGADAAFGFQSTITMNEYVELWSTTFFDSFGDGDSMLMAANDAKNAVYAKFGGYYGYNSWTYKGNLTVVLKPPAYGS